MTKHPIDTEKLVVALHRLTRDRLLAVAERAIELVPRAKLRDLVDGIIDLDGLRPTTAGGASLLREVREFHEKARRGDYYESFNVTSKNFMDQSEETETFIADFNRLIGKCVGATKKPPRARMREAFELLFALLRRIDQGHDDVIFFADEGGAWQVGVEWRTALPRGRGASGDLRVGRRRVLRGVGRQLTDNNNQRSGGPLDGYRRDQRVGTSTLALARRTYKQTL